MKKLSTLQSFDDWKKSYLAAIADKKRRSVSEKNIYQLATDNTLTKVQVRVLDGLLNNEYKIYKAEFEAAEKAQKLAEKQKDLLRRLRTKKPRSDAWKARNHELIKIGAITNVVGIEKDAGLIAGIYANYLQRVAENPTLKNQLKQKGDAILHARKRENAMKK